MKARQVLCISVGLIALRLFMGVVAFMLLIASCAWLLGAEGPILPARAYWLMPASHLTLAILYFLHYRPLLLQPKSRRILRVVLVCAVVFNLRFFFLPVYYSHPKLAQFPKMADNFEAARYNLGWGGCSGHTEDGITYWYIKQPVFDPAASPFIVVFIFLPVAFYAWGVYLISRGITLKSTLVEVFPRVFGESPPSRANTD